MTLDYWRKFFSVNLEGPLRLSQQVAPIMRDVGGGSIVNIATMAGYSGGPNTCVRCVHPAEIIGPVLYLASAASSFVTCDDISVSGGRQK